MYEATDDGLGAKYAAEFYHKYDDAFHAEREIDKRSLAELCTALVLFDSLRWEATSYLQEKKPMAWEAALPLKKDQMADAWIYKWFPKFQLAPIEPHIACNSDMQLQVARQQSLQWTAKRLQEGKCELPPNFRIPRAYYDKESTDYIRMKQLNDDTVKTVRAKNIPCALFLSRGMIFRCGWLPRFVQG